MGPLQSEVLALICHNLARTNRGVLAWLRVRYLVNRKTVDVSLSKLAKRGAVRRIHKGYYEPSEGARDSA